MLDYGMPHLDSSIVADGWIKDAGSKLKGEAKKASKKATKFITQKAPKVLAESCQAALKTLLETGSLTAAVTRLVTTAASESVEIGKTEAEKLVKDAYNKAAGTQYEHADFISFANGLPAHHKLLKTVAKVVHAAPVRRTIHKVKHHGDSQERNTASPHATVLPYLDDSSDEESSD
ncbi:hypothetical protein KIPB_005191 [Kipferlia bialata]|uniref:Uncharacterized protein n=1 Tax=Kipferlia bialata TaxID=797122 RepID=A0A391NTX6_9EUKA|nr:hypothetical protein KIPB_005191 [Kipferlia bialata]|eukprot:g5191.t1